MRLMNKDDVERLQAFRELHIEYDAIRYAREKIHQFRMLGRARAGEARCAILYGPTGAGKTRCVDVYVEEENQAARDRGCKVDPVRKIELPAKCTPKALNEFLLRELGSAMGARESTALSTVRIANGIVHQEWELIILDEVQHLFRHNTPSVAYEVSDHFKQLLNAAGCPILFVGMQEIERILEVNKQLRRRSAPAIVLKAFDFEMQDDRHTFRAILHEFDQALPFDDLAGLDELDLARRVHFATGGAIGEVWQLLFDASVVAKERNARTLGIDHLRMAFEAHRLSSEDRKLNPFSAEKLPEKSRPRDTSHGILQGKRGKLSSRRGN